MAKMRSTRRFGSAGTPKVRARSRAVLTRQVEARRPFTWPQRGVATGTRASSLAARGGSFAGREEILSYLPGANSGAASAGCFGYAGQQQNAVSHQNSTPPARRQILSYIPGVYGPNTRTMPPGGRRRRSGFAGG